MIMIDFKGLKKNASFFKLIPYMTILLLLVLQPGLFAQADTLPADTTVELDEPVTDTTTGTTAEPDASPAEPGAELDTASLDTTAELSPATTDTGTATDMNKPESGTTSGTDSTDTGTGSDPIPADTAAEPESTAPDLESDSMSADTPAESGTPTADLESGVAATDIVSNESAAADPGNESEPVIMAETTETNTESGTTAADTELDPGIAGDEVTTADHTTTFKPGPVFSAGLNGGASLPLGEAAATLNPGLMPMASFGFNFNLKRVTLGLVLCGGINIANNENKNNINYVLQLTPALLKFRFCTKPEALNLGIPLLLFGEIGGGVVFSLLHYYDAALNPPDADFSTSFDVAVLWDLGVGYLITSWLSVSLANTTSLFFLEDYIYFAYTPNLRVDFYF